MTQNFFEGSDPFAFMRQMCANIGVPLPGMVFPTMDLADVERRIAELRRVQRGLKKLIAACPGHGPLDACPILAALGNQETP